MDFLIALVILLGLSFIGTVTTFTVIGQKHRRRVIDHLSEIGVLTETKLKSHDYEMTVKGSHYKIKLVYTPGAHEVSFNSKRHWQVFTPSNKKMLETNGFYELEGKKVIVIYPNPGKIVKYINENEIVFVKPNMDVFGMHVINCDQIDSYFSQT
ncbi:MAG: hypothetical protein RBQ91_00190 [Acholeplasma sp.]|nr:hypothetical protein [Acholeplasma sp.]